MSSTPHAKIILVKYTFFAKKVEKCCKICWQFSQKIQRYMKGLTWKSHKHLTKHTELIKKQVCNCIKCFSFKEKLVS